MTSLEKNDRPPLHVGVPHPDRTSVSIILSDDTDEDPAIGLHLGMPRKAAAAAASALRGAIEAAYAEAYNTGYQDACRTMEAVIGHDNLAAVVDKAEADAVTAHRMGKCGGLGWPCPHCVGTSS